MKNKALVDTLDETLTGRALRHLATLWAMSKLLDWFEHTLPGAETNTVENTLVNVRVEALIDKLAVTLLEAKSDTWGQERLCGNQKTSRHAG